MTKRIDYYAAKADARKNACGELNGALAALVSAQQRVEAANKALADVQHRAKETLDARLAELTLRYEKDVAEARVRAEAAVHSARSEHGTAAALLAKAHDAVEQARERLLRLVPTHNELLVDVEATHDEARASA